VSDTLNVPRFVSSSGIRLATCVFWLLGVAAAVLYAHGSHSEACGIAIPLAVISGILALIGTIHSFRGTYLLWMKFASVVHVTVVTALFASCYLVVVPVFFLIAWAVDPLRLRNRDAASTYWIRRQRAKVSAASLQRMG